MTTTGTAIDRFEDGELVETGDEVDLPNVLVQIGEVTPDLFRPESRRAADPGSPKTLTPVPADAVRGAGGQPADGGVRFIGRPGRRLHRLYRER